jgi:cytosine/adenosine deaminase-related metal-dependent hydrolase
VDRRTEQGKILGGAAEGLTAEEALRTYTDWAAQATGTADRKGTLRRGKLADFAVLTGSPLAVPDISGLEVLATIVGGEFSYDRLGAGPVAVSTAVPGAGRTAGPAPESLFAPEPGAAVVR